MAKLIKAVAPYQYKDGINFKTQTFDAVSNALKIGSIGFALAIKLPF